MSIITALRKRGEEEIGEQESKAENLEAARGTGNNKQLADQSKWCSGPFTHPRLVLEVVKRVMASTAVHLRGKTRPAAPRLHLVQVERTIGDSTTSTTPQTPSQDGHFPDFRCTSSSDPRAWERRPPTFDLKVSKSFFQRQGGIKMLESLESGKLHAYVGPKGAAGSAAGLSSLKDSASGETS